MKKKILIKENQLKKILIERKDDDYLVYLAKKLKEIPCDGSGIKYLINKELVDYGFEGVEVKFIGYEENNNNLMYVAYTKGPIFVVKARSSSDDKPCMEVVYVQAYEKVN